MSEIEQVQEIKKAKILKNVLVDVKVEADLSEMLWHNHRHYKDPLELAKDLNEACKEFHNFLRDHRSQDMVRLSTVEIRKNLCSACEIELEIDNKNGKEYCANCGAEIERE